MADPIGHPPYHRPLTIAGQTYDFPHLEPFELTVASQKVGRALRIHVRFTDHCFSESFDATSNPPDVFTFPDTGGRPRVFCPARYDLSRHLRSAIQGLGHPKGAGMADRATAKLAALRDSAGPGRAIPYLLRIAAHAGAREASPRPEPDGGERLSPGLNEAAACCTGADRISLAGRKGLQRRTDRDEAVKTRKGTTWCPFGSRSGHRFGLRLGPPCAITDLQVRRGALDLIRSVAP